MAAFLVGQFREALWTVLVAGWALLALMLVALVCVRLWIKAARWRRVRLEHRYGPLVAALTTQESAGDALALLTRVPARHLDVIGRLMLKPLSLTDGQVVDYLRAGATAIGLERHWRRLIRSRHWWDRARGVHALGLIRKPGVTDEVLTLMNDPHEEVRSAAVGALGWLADPSTVPALLAGLADETRHQKVRIIEALQHFGAAAGPAVLAHVRAQPSPDPVLADLVGHLRLTAAMDLLIEWTGRPEPALRAAAIRTIGILGPDDRAYYHLIKALGDEDAAVCAMAARALGRSGRDSATPYLVPLLEREWTIAVEAALALARLGDTGRAALQERARGAGEAAALAGHVLWEGRAAATP